jgi:hypothetical protein
LVSLGLACARSGAARPPFNVPPVRRIGRTSVASCANVDPKAATEQAKPSQTNSNHVERQRWRPAQDGQLKGIERKCRLVYQCRNNRSAALKSFEDCKPDILLTVDGPRGPTGDGPLPPNFVEALAELWTSPVFFVRRGRALQQKARGIHELAREAIRTGVLGPDDLPGRNDLEAIAYKRPVTLNVATRLRRFFAIVEERGAPDLQAMCRHQRQPTGPLEVFGIGANDIIPSCYQVKPKILGPMRDKHGLKKVKFGKILFADNGEDLMDAHEKDHAPYVTYYFAADVHQRLKNWAQTIDFDLSDYEDPTDLFKRVSQPRDKALLPIDGNNVPD